MLQLVSKLVSIHQKTHLDRRQQSLLVKFGSGHSRFIWGKNMGGKSLKEVSTVKSNGRVNEGKFNKPPRRPELREHASVLIGSNRENNLRTIFQREGVSLRMGTPIAHMIGQSSDASRLISLS